MPADMSKYPSDWKAISLLIRGLRARWRCEWPGCGAVNGQPNPETGSRVVLTVAHLREAENEMDCRDEVLRAWCQLHHLRYDAQLHGSNAAATRRRKAEAAGQTAMEVAPA